MTLQTWVEIGTGGFAIITTVVLTAVVSLFRDRPRLRLVMTIVALVLISGLALLAVGYADEHIR